MVVANKEAVHGGEIVKIGVISDTHLDEASDKLKAVVERYFADVDLVVHAGDLVDLSVLEIFHPRDVKAVCGNMDNSRVREKLPEQLIFEIKGFKFGLIHGWGSPRGLEERLKARFGDVDCVIYGHTHQPANVKKDNVLFFNPGSAAQRHFLTSRTVGILEIDRDITGNIIHL